MAAVTHKLPDAQPDRRVHAFVTRVRERFTWNRLYRAASYARSALWIVPLAAIVLVMALAPLLRMLDAWLGWPVSGLDPDGAQALFQTVITLTLSFLVFTFGSLLVAIQVAGGQLTPRVIATTLLRDNVVRYTVGLFVFTLVLTVSALNRMQAHVPHIATVTIGVLGCVGMMAFLFLIDYCARLLRPVTILTRLGEMGLDVIDAVYPQSLSERDDEEAAAPRMGKPARTLLHVGASGVVLAVDVPALVEAARRRGGVIELAPCVGDFLAYGQPLFHLHGGATAVADRDLVAAVALGGERTLEQDPMFAFRIIVDIALKALSPAINDPTTAVLAIDQVHRLLRAVGGRRLRVDVIRGRDGLERVVLRMPDWEDYVNISCNEIRACGVSSIQVARRMRAMLDDLAVALPPQRRAALDEERTLLDRAVRDAYKFAEDAALAREPDVQGIGSAARIRTRSN